ERSHRLRTCAREGADISRRAAQPGSGARDPARPAGGHRPGRYEAGRKRVVRRTRGDLRRSGRVQVSSPGLEGTRIRARRIAAEPGGRSRVAPTREDGSERILEAEAGGAGRTE